VTRGWFRGDGTSDDKREGWPKAAVKRPWDRPCEEPRHDRCLKLASRNHAVPVSWGPTSVPQPCEARRAETPVAKWPDHGHKGRTVHHDKPTHLVRNARRVCHEATDAGGDCWISFASQRSMRLRTTRSSMTGQASRNITSCADKHARRNPMVFLPWTSFAPSVISHTRLRGILWSTSRSFCPRRIAESSGLRCHPTTS
jgi:hypothetical protein